MIVTDSETMGVVVGDKACSKGVRYLVLLTDCS